MDITQDEPERTFQDYIKSSDEEIAGFEQFLAVKEANPAPWRTLHGPIREEDDVGTPASVRGNLGKVGRLHSTEQDIARSKFPESSLATLERVDASPSGLAATTRAKARQHRDGATSTPRSDRSLSPTGSGRSSIRFAKSASNFSPTRARPHSPLAGIPEGMDDMMLGQPASDFGLEDTFSGPSGMLGEGSDDDDDVGNVEYDSEGNLGGDIEGDAEDDAHSETAGMSNAPTRKRGRPSKPKKADPRSQPLPTAVLSIASTGSNWRIPSMLGPQVAKKLETFNASMARSKARGKFYTKMITNAEEELNAPHMVCVPCLMIGRGNAKKRELCQWPNGEDRACNTCCNSKKPCARLIRHQNELAVGFLPLPDDKRGQAKWSEEQAWIFK